MKLKPAISVPVCIDGTPLPLYPIGDRIVVERMDEDEQLVSGVYIPRQDKDKIHYGVVLAAGPVALDVLRTAFIEIGDTVCFGQYAGVKWWWRVPGTVVTKTVDIISAKDVYGCQQLAEKMLAGQLNVHFYQDSQHAEHRFGTLIEETP